MVKKVIDIIPPETRPASQAVEIEEEPLRYSQFPQGNTLPEESGPVPEAKPRITYVSHNESGGDGRQGVSRGGKGGFLKGLLFKLAAAVAVIMLAMYGVDVKFAKAVVKIWPATSDMRQEIKVGIDPAATSIDKAKFIIPGLVVSVEDTIKGESLATGKKDVQGKAQGTVKLFNNYTVAQRLVKGTRLQAPLEKFQPALAKDETPWFRTAEDVVLGPKSSATVKVIADGAGEKYNIDPSVFSVPGLVGTAQYTFIYGQSFEKFQGGTQGNAAEVKKEDLDSAKTYITDLAKVEIAKKLEAKIKEQGLELVDPSTEKFDFGSAVISAKIGDGISKIPSQMTAKATTVAYRRSDLDNLGKDFILSKVPVGSVANDKSLQMGSSFAGIDAASGRTSLSLVATITIYSGMGEDDLKKGLSEKGISEAKIFLMNQTGMKDVKIEIVPPWRLNIPRELDRIEVQTILE